MNPSRQPLAVNSLNELTTVTNGGRLTVAGSTTSPATNVTVNTSNAVLYADVAFASTNQPWASGNNSYTAIARDVHGRRDTNSITVSLAGTNSYSYDLNGNLLSDGTRGFAYDDENQLIRVTVTNAWKTEFCYDGKMRRRIVKEFAWNGSSWTQTNEVHFIYDGNLVLQERDANNLPLVTYTRGNDLSGTLQGAGGIGGLLARTDNAKLIIADPFASAYYHCDGNGNVTCLINSYQQIAAKYLYDPYGNMLSMYGSLADANTYRFSSKEWNASSGLYYYLYRFYDSSLQRWPNRDPLGEAEDIDIYQFVHNDSLNFVDTLGLRKDPSCVAWCRANYNGPTVGGQGTVVGVGGGILTRPKPGRGLKGSPWKPGGEASRYGEDCAKSGFAILAGIIYDNSGSDGYIALLGCLSGCPDVPDYCSPNASPGSGLDNCHANGPPVLPEGPPPIWNFPKPKK